MVAAHRLRARPPAHGGVDVIHYHGNPITPRAKLLELAGGCFCVSFAHPRDVQACHQIGQHARGSQRPLRRDGAVIAITIVNAKWLLDRDGEIKLTIPSRVPAADLAPALAG
jgi:hypothetical protein